ncbi:MAG TPA: RNA polymerase factor sigma-54, partial [Burkholderiales bacterium]|nr:RNA polymerase factor sigma-54 [Burkholderiales bacterium]
MKPSLQLRLSQHLTLTPQLQQSIRLLQLSTVELNQEIERILMENPALEREDHDGEADAPHAPAAAGPAAQEKASEPAEADWPVDIAAGWRGGDDEDSDRSFSAPDTPTLRDHLCTQLTLTNLGERDRVFVALLIDALDDDG